MWSRTLVLSCMCLVTGKVLAEKCVGPDDKEGQCVALSSCPEIVKVFANPKRGSEAFLHQFICDYRKQIKVCCSASFNATRFAELNSVRNEDPGFSDKVQFFEIAKKFCSVPNYYPRYGKDSASISYLEIRAINKGSELHYTKCVGLLITERYVVTAAECIVQTCRTPRFSVVGVRFQLANSKNKTYRSFDIEEEIPHPFYDAASGINNIALLRLNTTVFKGRDNFWPNCLHVPEHKVLNLPLTAAITLRFHKEGKELLIAKLLPNKECKQIFESKKLHNSITTYEACTSGISNTSTIRSTVYPGEPLFVSDDDFNKFIDDPEIRTEARDLFLGGISSSKTIFEDGIPVIYTNVSIYLDWILEAMRPWSVNDKPCLTPNNDEGVCMFMVHCPELMEEFANPKKGQEEYLREFLCETNEGDTGIYVCCSNKTDFTTFHEEKKNIQNLSSKSPFLDFAHCGIQHKDDYFTRDDNITIDEFPWIATILEKEKATVVYTGSLINARYVLTTAAETVYIDTDGLIVRLGDFSRTNKTDCVEEPDIYAVDCTEYEDFSIEEVIPHPFYSFLDDIHNIALFRLDRKVTYTDFIRPICLPVPRVTTAKPGNSVYTSSWGEESEGEVAELKKKVSMTLLSHNQCTLGFRKHHDATFVTSYTMCALYSKVGEIPLCFADKGGSLMFHNNYQWHIEGILIDNFFFGYRDCRSKRKPLVYTRISKYLDWILQNMHLPI